MSNETVNQTVISTEALDKLNQTLTQYQVSKIASIQVPEFKGSPGEDVYDFLKKFKLATLSFDDKVRCVALNKALVGPAHTWAKDNLKLLIANQDWKGCKKALAERFALPNQDLRHQEKLHKLKFNPKENTLMSYVEEYASVYRKAYKGAGDKDVIRALSLNLPKDILKNLNLISDNWSSSESLPEFLLLIKRLESKILPYEPNEEEAGEKVSLAALTKMLAEIKNTLSAQVKDTKDNGNKTDASLALVTTENQDKRVRFNEPQRTFNNQYTRRYQPYRNYQQRPQERYYEKSRPQWPSNNERRLLPLEDKDQKGKAPDLVKSYYQTYGKPPNPCFTCGQDHFNRHCPFRELNLN